MQPTEVLDSSLDDLRSSLEEDDVRLWVDRRVDDEVVVKVQAGACNECMVPDEILRDIVAAALRSVDETVATVSIEHIAPATEDGG